MEALLSSLISSRACLDCDESASGSGQRGPLDYRTFAHLSRSSAVNTLTHDIPTGVDARISSHVIFKASKDMVSENFLSITLKASPYLKTRI